MFLFNVNESSEHVDLDQQTINGVTLLDINLSKIIAFFSFSLKVLWCSFNKTELNEIESLLNQICYAKIYTEYPN